MVSQIAYFMQININAIDQICDIMVNTTIGEEVTRLAEVTRFVLDEKNKLCLDYKYDKMIADMKNTSWMSKFATGGIRDNRKKFSLKLENIFQFDNGPIRHALNLASTRLPTMPPNYLAIASM